MQEICRMHKEIYNCLSKNCMSEKGKKIQKVEKTKLKLKKETKAKKVLLNNLMESKIRLKMKISGRPLFLKLKLHKKQMMRFLLLLTRESNLLNKNRCSMRNRLASKNVNFARENSMKELMKNMSKSVKMSLSKRENNLI